jgi:hypothetical protein
MSYQYDYQLFNGIGNGSPKTIPVQTLPQKKKTPKWEKATMDALESEGIQQLHKNIVFRESRKMIEGEFTYQAVDMESPMNLPWFDKEVRKMRNDLKIPTYLKHFDFIGIIVNAIVGIYRPMDNRYRVESQDEYSTNEWIRQKTEGLHKYAAAVLEQEVNKMLLSNGLDPQKNDFESEEEQQAYQQQLSETVKNYTPSEIEKNLSKNFKVLATEWAQNTLTADLKRFELEDKDSENLIDYILTGRFFRHYRVGYDNYSIESWMPEETFFDQNVLSKYPQDGEYVGKITSMTVSQVLSTYGHLMTTKQMELIGNYWAQDTKYEGGGESSGGTFLDNVFPKQRVVPFHNYYDHQINLQMESALGIPMGEKLVANSDGSLSKQDTYLPRQENDFNGTFHSGYHSRYLRDDIDVRLDTIRVTEVYWRSQKRIGILIYENSLGSLSIEEVTDDLFDDFLKDNEIKKLRDITIDELQNSLRRYDLGETSALDEYINTITYIYIPEVWHGIKIKGNAATIKDDIYLQVKPLDYQIKGDSNYFDVRLPVSGIITNGIIKKILPYQQLHNIAMNQITELLEKELGVFFSFDVNALPSEYQDETTEESVYRIRDLIKDSALLPLDPSRQNTSNNISNPNIFQKQEIVYATQVQYRWQLAQDYKNEAFGQLGITPQILGAPSTYETAEGVKQGAQATYSLLTPLMEKFNTAKNKGMEVHLAVAQYCETNGKSVATIMRKGDGEQAFLNILKEDPELFPLRKLSIMPITSSKDAKAVEMIRSIVMNDNTFEKDLGDIIEIMTNPVIVEIQQAAYDMRKRKQKAVEEERAFQSEQSDKLIASEDKRLKDERDNEIELERMGNETAIEVAQLSAYGRLGDKQVTDMAMYDRVDALAQNSIQNTFKAEELKLKQTSATSKIAEDRENRKIKLAELIGKSEDRRLKEKQLDIQMTSAIINKN